MESGKSISNKRVRDRRYCQHCQQIVSISTYYRYQRAQISESSDDFEFDDDQKLDDEYNLDSYPDEVKPMEEEEEEIFQVRLI